MFIWINAYTAQQGRQREDDRDTKENAGGE